MAPLRTRRASFPATGSPVTMPWIHGGHQLLFRRFAFRIPHSLSISSHLAPLALCPALPDSLVGRYSHDYYEATVAIGLAPLRRSHVRLCHTCRARLRCPFRLLEYPHWISRRTLEVVPTSKGCRHRTRRRFQASFRRMDHCIFWRLRFKQSS